MDDIPFKEKILKMSLDADRKVLEFFFRDMQKRALALDVKEERRQVTVGEIFSALRNREVPIILVNAKSLHREDVPHWIVVKGHDSNKVFIHDPLWRRPQSTGIGIHDFEEMIGYGTGQVVIVVSAKHFQRVDSAC